MKFFDEHIRDNENSSFIEKKDKNLRLLEKELALLGPENLEVSDYEKIYDDYAKRKTLKIIRFIGATDNAIASRMSENLLGSLENCICNSPLDRFVLIYTFLLPETLDAILNLLAVHPTLKTVVLNECRLTSKSLPALMNLMSKSHTLEDLDISGHQLKDETSLFSAIKASRSLITLKGVKSLTSAEEIHLQQNQYFKDLEDEISEQEFQKIKDLIGLKVQKNFFYRIVVNIRKNPHDKKRLNQYLARFFMAVAGEYHRFGKYEEAGCYYKRIFYNQDYPELQYQAHQSYAEMLYLQFCGFKEVMNSCIIPAKFSSQAVKAAALQVGFKAFKHLNAASSCSKEAAEKEKAQQLLKYLQISLGETLLEQADEPDSPPYFKRKYQKIN